MESCANPKLHCRTTQDRPGRLTQFPALPGGPWERTLVLLARPSWTLSVPSNAMRDLQGSLTHTADGFGKAPTHPEHRMQHPPGCRGHGAHPACVGCQARAPSAGPPQTHERHEGGVELSPAVSEDGQAGGPGCLCRGLQTCRMDVSPAWGQSRETPGRSISIDLLLFGRTGLSL